MKRKVRIDNLARFIRKHVRSFGITATLLFFHLLHTSQKNQTGKEAFNFRVWNAHHGTGSIFTLGRKFASYDFG